MKAHSQVEDRLIVLGHSHQRQLLVVVQTERGDSIRIIAAGAPADENGRRMKKATYKATETEMRAEYDFSRDLRGKYARRYAQGTNVVVLEADVAKIFPNAAAVNDSLRALAGIMRRQHKALAGK